MEAALPLLQMKNLHLSFGEIPALNGVDFDLCAGEIHALVGERRSGKSSLVKILSGDLRKQKGTILLAGREIEFFTPLSAIRNGIGIVYQNLNLIPSLSAVENIYAGRLPSLWLRPRFHDGLRERCRALMEELEAEVDLDVPAGQLSLAEQQMVEIARVLSLEPGIIIVDEISSRLNAAEMDHVLSVLRARRKQDKAIIYVATSADEIFTFADRVTVLKNGQRRGTERVKDLDRFKLLKLAYSFMFNIEEKDGERQRLSLIKRYNENIIADLPVGIIILDTDNRVFLSNQAARRILGAEERSLPASSVEELLEERKVGNAAEICEKVRGRERHSWEGVTVNGERFLLLKSFPLQDEDYAFTGTILMLEDVSMDHFIKEYLLRAEKIASIAELAAGVAHEINNPLGIIQNYVELLKLKGTDADGAEKLGKIENELNRIVAIVGSLLSFSRVSPLDSRRVNLGELLGEVILLLSHKLNQKNIRLSKSFPEAPIQVGGEENKLKQLFINLIMNSIEAVLDHGRIEVAVKSEGEKGYAEVAVADNGYGIPREIQDRIFTPFFSTKMTKTNAGLGLSICQHIAEAHRGVITFTSAPGATTCFTVKLPLA
jgi:two-component system, NtrC family, sensor histidine kinase AtoS